MNGAIRWFAENKVAANLMMVIIVVGGFVSMSRLKQEVFPEFALDLITVSVPYLGAAPEEVEEGVCIRVEEAIDGLEGIDKITSNSAEGVCTVSVQLALGADSRKLLDEIKSEIDAIDTFPEETEEPIVAEMTNRRGVISVAVYGEADERSLRNLAEQIRDELTESDAITIVELSNARPYEIGIEVSEETLRRFGLTLDDVANAVRRSSLDLPGGSVRTPAGEVLLRTKGQAYVQEEFESLVLLTRPDGTELRVGDVATIVDGFAETDQFSRFEGQSAILMDVFRVGEEDALSIASAVHRYVEDKQLDLPEGVGLAAWNDASKVLKDRRDLLLRNGIVGLGLVFVMLTIFLRLRLAFWVTVGLFIAFMGTLWLMPTLDTTINLISLFAFILVLGIVVDDAIVVGESIYTQQKRMKNGPEGAIFGAQTVSRPVIFAVLTTVAAFAPLLNIEGTTGKIMKFIPLIVIPCLLWSLVESLWILPAHLSHYTARRRDTKLERGMTFFADGLERVITRYYKPVVEFALRWRYATLALGLGTLLVTLGLVGGGQLGFVYFPNVEADYVSAAVTMPPGSPVEATSAAVAQLEQAADEVREELNAKYGEDQFQFLVSSIGEQPFRRLQAENGGSVAGREVFSNLGEMTIELRGAEVRSAGAEETVALWREKVGQIPDAIELAYTASLFSPGEDVNVQLAGRNVDDLIAAADLLKGRLAEYGSVYEIADSFRRGKRELKLDIKPEAETTGLTLSDLGRQVRQAFYGEEAQRIQRGRDDIRVMVRYPREQRETLASLETMRVRRPDGLEVPFSEVAEVDEGLGYSTIKRVDRRRTVNVTADVDETVQPPGDIVAALRADVLPEIEATYPGISWTFEGQQEEQRKTLQGLWSGFVLAAIMIYVLLAVPLRSYVQPLVIMSAIPFGLVGAAWGHLMIGMPLTILSMFGIVALTGVVVNDSLVMVDFINRQRDQGGELLAAVRDAGAARFRPILLTSLTTFGGLSPLMLERSMQARFLIPMAVSLAFGVLFATFITLVLVPSGYMILDDIGRAFRWIYGKPGRVEEDQKANDDVAPGPGPAGEPGVVTARSRIDDPPATGWTER